MGGQRSHGCRRHNWFRNQTISFNESHTNLERRHRHWVGGGELLEPAECTLYKTGRGCSRAKSSFIDAFGSATGFRVGGGLVTDKPEAGTSQETLVGAIVESVEEAVEKAIDEVEEAVAEVREIVVDVAEEVAEVAAEVVEIAEEVETVANEIEAVVHSDTVEEIKAEAEHVAEVAVEIEHVAEEVVAAVAKEE